MALEQDITNLTLAANQLTETVTDKIGDIDSKVTAAEARMDNFIHNARSEYIRFTHYVALPEKVFIPALGLSENEIAQYTYDMPADYTPAKSDGTVCFADIVEFANGFNQVPLPDGMHAYLNLLVNVAGSVAATMHTKVHMLRLNTAQEAYHPHDSITEPFLLLGEEDNPIHDISGRDWGDKYQDRNQLKITNFYWRNYLSWTTLRVLNLGKRDLEIFGVGIEVRQ
ncbi:hypothetical protein [Algicola sagamiensis]|uniref:hypothetical protein n=1 Tax=Algicola sagamiensis TaxID=163869 RepID=UPI0003773FD6|nr:hypothetical protein [Algicola sagamiensis]